MRAIISRSKATFPHILLAAFLLRPRLAVAGPHSHLSAQAGFHFNELFARYECSGEVCGWDDQVCCSSGHACYTNADDQAACSATTEASSGYWEYSTTTYIETDLETITSTLSSYVETTATETWSSATASPSCNYANDETPCGDICCSSTQFCLKSGQCESSEASSSAYYSSWSATRTASSPVRPTSSSIVTTTETQIPTTTETQTPTTTLPYQTPVSTGANITITGDSHSNNLSGGDIAGIVIGVLVGLFLLGLLCFYCCLKGLLDGFLALFGFGDNRRRRTTEVDEYERRSHYDSRGNVRTWYGRPRAPPAGAATARSSRRGSDRRGSNVGADLLGIGACLAALWAVLGLKRRQDNNNRRNVEKYSQYSDDRTYYSDDYYTSASSASTNDRRTRITQQDRRSERASRR